MLSIILLPMLGCAALVMGGRFLERATTVAARRRAIALIIAGALQIGIGEVARSYTTEYQASPQYLGIPGDMGTFE